MKIKKILFLLKINFLIFIFALSIIELFFGYWLDNNQFSFHMRGKRMQKIEFNFERENFSKKVVFKRDYYGFREDFEFDNKYDLSKNAFVKGTCSFERLPRKYHHALSTR